MANPATRRNLYREFNLDTPITYAPFLYHRDPDAPADASKVTGAITPLDAVYWTRIYGGGDLDAGLLPARSGINTLTTDEVAVVRRFKIHDPVGRGLVPRTREAWGVNDAFYAPPGTFGAPADIDGYLPFTPAEDATIWYVWNREFLDRDFCLIGLGRTRLAL